MDHYPTHVSFLQPFARLVSTVALLIVLGIVLSGFIPQYRKHMALERRLAEVRAEKAREEARLADLQQRQERFQTDRDYVRRIAHENGYVQANEMIFRFHEDTYRSRTAQP